MPKTMDFSRTYSKVGALDAFDAGVPSVLPPGNKFKPALEAHRWGKHGGSPKRGCPACERIGIPTEPDLETCSLCLTEVDDAMLTETDAGRICPDCT